jgi:hypothetical protein
MVMQAAKDLTKKTDLTPFNAGSGLQRWKSHPEPVHQERKWLFSELIG